MSELLGLDYFFLYLPSLSPAGRWSTQWYVSMSGSRDDNSNPQTPVLTDKACHCGACVDAWPRGGGDRHESVGSIRQLNHLSSSVFLFCSLFVLFAPFFVLFFSSNTKFISIVFLSPHEIISGIQIFLNKTFIGQAETIYMCCAVQEGWFDVDATNWILTQVWRKGWISQCKGHNCIYAETLKFVNLLPNNVCMQTHTEVQVPVRFSAGINVDLKSSGSYRRKEIRRQWGRLKKKKWRAEDWEEERGGRWSKGAAQKVGKGKERVMFPHAGFLLSQRSIKMRQRSQKKERV